MQMTEALLQRQALEHSDYSLAIPEEEAEENGGSPTLRLKQRLKHERVQIEELFKNRDLHESLAPDEIKIRKTNLT